MSVVIVGTGVVGTGLGTLAGLYGTAKIAEAIIVGEAKALFEVRFPVESAAIDNDTATSAQRDEWNAFVHAYTSWRLADLTGSEDFSHFMGDGREEFTEMLGNNSAPERNKDDWNNGFGRDMFGTGLTQTQVADRLKQEILDNRTTPGSSDLIIDEDTDPRLYDGPRALPDGNLFDDLKDLADDYGWAWENPGAVLAALPPWLQSLLSPVAALLGIAPSGGGVGGGGLEPLVFDLDASGTIDLIALANGVHFDFWGDGHAERVGWADATDGMLAIDLDSSGTIDNGAELFGSESPLTYLVNENWDAFVNEENGFAKLAKYDLIVNGGNADGAITSADDVWSDLIMWRDANSDGISQSGEMHTLSYFSITSIDVSDYQLDSFFGLSGGGFTRLIEGNTITHTGSFTMGGVEREVVDVWFTSDLVRTTYAGEYELDPRTLYLPTVRGYGMIPDLHIAMSVNEDLLDEVIGFATSHSFGNLFDDIRDDAEEIMLSWAGLDATNLPNFDYSNHGMFEELKEYWFIRKLLGQDNDGLGTWFDMSPHLPYVDQGVLMMRETYNSFLDAFSARVIFQSGGSELFEAGVRYNPYTDEFEGTFAVSQDAVDDLEIAAGLSGDIAAYWREVATFIDNTMGISELSGTEIGWLNDAIDDSSLGALDWTDILSSLSLNVVEGTSGNNTINGTALDDVLNVFDDTGTFTSFYGTDGTDTVNGLGGDDVIYGGNGNDTLNGGTGDDVLYGEFGDDTYIYDYGHDVIVENSPAATTDVIQLAAGISTGDVSIHLARVDSNSMQPHLFLEIEGRGTLTIMRNYGTQWAMVIDQIQFNGGPTWTLDSTPIHIHGHTGDDLVYSTGFTSNNFIMGYEGDDILNGESGNDTLYGGEGNDDLRGGYGNDSYMLGNGNDVIREDNGTDKIIIPEGYTLDDISFLRVEAGGTYGMHDEMQIVVEGLGSITVMNTFGVSGTNRNVETVQLFDLTTINLASAVFTTIGSAGNDFIQGTPTAWGQPNDIYLFGTGQDTVYEYGGTDAVQFAEGVLPSSVTIARTMGNSTADLTISDGLGNSMTFQSHFGSTATNRALEAIHFANGTIWTIAAMEIETHGTNAGENIFAFAWGDASQNDTVFAYDGNDQVQGDAGNDFIDGGAGDDSLDGGADNDTVSYLTASAGVTVNLATGTAQNTGGAGTDTISNFENLIGSSYNDTLTGDGNANIMEGGAGNDTINGTGGTDTLSYERATAGITINLATATAQNTGGAGTDTISSFENLRGSAFNDTLSGTSGNNVIEGGAGNDTINAQGGTDTLTYANASAAITVSLALATAQNTGGAGTDTISNFENLTGSNFNDVLTGSTAANTISGGDGNDTIQGGGGNDTLTGGNGVDTVSYANAASATTFNLSTTSSQNTVSSGSDTVSGFENIVGSAFGDTLTGNSSDNVIEGGAGNDTINGSGGNDTASYTSAGSAVTVNLSTATAQNTVGAGTDTLSSMENLTGSIYNDTLTGSTAANVIRGGDGTDTISAGNGNDFLYGGAGPDTLTGGANADTFVFEAATAFGASDTITDFSTAQIDKLNIADLLNGYDPLTDLISDFVRITDNGSNSVLSVDADGGANGFVQIASLTGVTNIAAGATATEGELQTLITNGMLIAA